MIMFSFLCSLKAKMTAATEIKNASTRSISTLTDRGDGMQTSSVSQLAGQTDCLSMTHETKGLKKQMKSRLKLSVNTLKMLVNVDFILLFDNLTSMLRKQTMERIPLLMDQCS